MKEELASQKRELDTARKSLGKATMANRNLLEGSRARQEEANRMRESFQEAGRRESTLQRELLTLRQELTEQKEQREW